MAQEPAGQQRRRRSRRSATASTPTATSPPTGATTTRAPRRSRRARPIAARRRRRSRSRRPPSSSSTWPGSSFMVNYHSNGQWLLYNDGWQVGTPTADDPIYYALSGNLDEPAIEGFHPGLLRTSSTSPTARSTVTPRRPPARWRGRPRLSRLHRLRLRLPRRRAAGPGGVPPQPALRPVGRRVRGRPRRPEVALGIKTKPFYLESEDAYKAASPRCTWASRSRTATRSPSPYWPSAASGAVTARWRVNGGAGCSPRPRPSGGGGSTGSAMTSTHYHQVRGVVTRHRTRATRSRCGSPAAANGARRSPTVPSPSRATRVLVVAAEDYTGASPAQSAAARTTSTTTSTPSTANGLRRGRLRRRRQGRLAPDALGVLSHYDARHLVHR